MDENGEGFAVVDADFPAASHAGSDDLLKVETLNEVADDGVGAE